MIKIIFFPERGLEQISIEAKQNLHSIKNFPKIMVKIISFFQKKRARADYTKLAFL